jgi:hypothetical protein
LVRHPTYELWRLENGRLYAVRLETCEPFVVSEDDGVDGLTTYFERVAAFAGPLDDAAAIVKDPRRLTEVNWIDVSPPPAVGWRDWMDTLSGSAWLLARELEMERPTVEVFARLELEPHYSANSSRGSSKSSDIK